MSTADGVCTKHVSGQGPAVEKVSATNEADARICRLCFETDSDLSRVVEPCECKGSQPWVHLNCLRRWQRIQLHEGRGSPLRCPTCTAEYRNIPPPPRPSLAVRVRMLYRMINWVCVTHICFIASGSWYALSGPPWETDLYRSSAWPSRQWIFRLTALNDIELAQIAGLGPR